LEAGKGAINAIWQYLKYLHNLMNPCIWSPYVQGFERRTWSLSRGRPSTRFGCRHYFVQM